MKYLPKCYLKKHYPVDFQIKKLLNINFFEVKYQYTDLDILIIRFTDYQFLMIIKSDMNYLPYAPIYLWNINYLNNDHITSFNFHSIQFLRTLQFKFC